jgi:hypothetical protein
VLMHSLSNAGSGGIVEGAAFIRILRFDLRFGEHRSISSLLYLAACDRQRHLRRDVVQGSDPRRKLR